MRSAQRTYKGQRWAVRRVYPRLTSSPLTEVPILTQLGGRSVSTGPLTHFIKTSGPSEDRIFNLCSNWTEMVPAKKVLSRYTRCTTSTLTRQVTKYTITHEASKSFICARRTKCRIHFNQDVLRCGVTRQHVDRRDTNPSSECRSKTYLMDLYIAAHLFCMNINFEVTSLVQGTVQQGQKALGGCGDDDFSCRRVEL